MKSQMLLAESAELCSECNNKIYKGDFAVKIEICRKIIYFCSEDCLMKTAERR